MKNSLRRIAALLMAVMMLAALGMSAAAADGVESLTFTKVLDKTNSENAYAPATTYTFNITAGTADTAKAVYAGVAGGALFDIATGDSATLTIVSDPAADGNGAWSKTGTIVFDASVFTHPGIYRYTVTESNTTYAGLVCDTTPRTLDVCVEEDGDSFKVTAVQLYYTETTGEGDEATTTTVKDKVFTNTYTTTNLTVSKSTTGNLAEKNREFSFTITITGEEDEQYHVVLPGNSNTSTITAGTPFTFNLKDGEEIVVYGLSAGDEFSVVEDDDCAADGYTTTVAVNGVSENSYTGEGTIADTAATVVFTNNRAATVPTGIAMTVLPFVAMIALAVLVAVFFFQKKERREA